MRAFNGLTFEQVEAKYPQELERLITQPDVRTPDDAESLNEFIQRVSATINKIVDENNSSQCDYCNSS